MAEKLHQRNGDWTYNTTTTQKTFDQKRTDIEQKINQGARLTEWKLHL